MTVAAAPASRHRAGRLTRPGVGWAFVTPALVVFAVFVVYPIVRMFALSLQSSDGFGDYTFAGLGNYKLLGSDPIFRQAVKVTIEYTLVSTLLQTVVPLVLALIVYAGPRRSSIVYRTIFFLPAAVSLTVTGLLWRIGLTPTFGALNRLLTNLGLSGLTHSWLGDPNTVVPTLLVVSLWQSCGLFMLIFYAGLGNIDPAVSESAQIDGAGDVRQAFYVTVPMLAPVIEIVVMLNMINGFKVFDLPFVMTVGGPVHASETMSTYVYLLTFGGSTGGVPSFGYASAVSVVVFIAAGIATLVLTKFRRKPDELR